VGADGKRTAVEELHYMLRGSFHKHDFLGFIKNCWTDEQIKRSIAAHLFPQFHGVKKKGGKILGRGAVKALPEIPLDL
jgi:hypothetical protein